MDVMVANVCFFFLLQYSLAKIDFESDGILPSRLLYYVELCNSRAQVIFCLPRRLSKPVLF